MGTIWEPNTGAVCRAGPPGEAGSSQPIVLYQWTRLIPVISCQHRALSSLVLSAQIKLMKCNPLKCPGCISVTGLRTQEGRQGEPAPRQGNIPPSPNLGFKSTLINPLIQHIFDSQLMRMKTGWSGQDRRCLSMVSGQGVGGWRTIGPQHRSTISFSAVILATNKPQCCNNSPHNVSAYIYSINPCKRQQKIFCSLPQESEHWDEDDCSAAKIVGAKFDNLTLGLFSDKNFQKTRRHYLWIMCRFSASLIVCSV